MLCAVYAQSKMRRMIIVPIIPVLFLQSFYLVQARLANYFIPKWKIIKRHVSAKQGDRGYKADFQGSSFPYDL